jgi:hypothetical protein
MHFVLDNDYVLWYNGGIMEIVCLDGRDFLQNKTE